MCHIKKMNNSTTIYVTNTEIVKDIGLNMSSYRTNKLNSLKKDPDKLRCKAATYLLNLGLQKYGLNECDMIYDVGSNGKPYFKNHSDIYFNISHSGKYVACAFSEVHIGIDIQIKDKANINIAKRFFTNKEYDYINKSENSENTFIRFWTLKESYLKCIGTGLSGGLSDFELSFNEDKAYVLKDGESFYFTETEDKDYFLSLCYPNENEQVNIEFIT